MAGREYTDVNETLLGSLKRPGFVRFIYHAYKQAHLPWAYGGEYDQFSEVIQKIVYAWLGLGIHLSFVFDGRLLWPNLLGQY